uniref:Uncharacterized protein n=1 Tax=Cohnella candidum TaxID=2674991 RepID=A0A3G3JZX7_9BACL|nr:hypothetical protein EAV92_13100 [Cohnella candidum]
MFVSSLWFLSTEIDYNRRDAESRFLLSVLICLRHHFKIPSGKLLYVIFQNRLSVFLIPAKMEHRSTDAVPRNAKRPPEVTDDFRRPMGRNA